MKKVWLSGNIYVYLYIIKIKVMISSRAIRKGITVKFDGKVVDKPAVIEASKTWEPKHETLFMKLLKQGGKFNANGVIVEVFPIEQTLTSRGEKDGGIITSDPLARF